MQEVISSIGNHQTPEIQSIIQPVHLCDYGCGNAANFKLNNSKWCCSKSYNACPIIKKKNSDKLKLSHKLKGHLPKTISRTLNNNKLKNYICTICNKSFFLTEQNMLKHKGNCNKIKYIQKHNNIYKNNLNNEGICKICGNFKTHLNPELCNLNLNLSFLVKNFNLDQAKIGTNGIYDELNKIKNLIYSEYYDNKLSIVAIAQKYNKNINHIYKIMTCFNMHRRSFSEANHIAMLTNRKKLNTTADTHTKYKQGWHTTWNNKRCYYRSSDELIYAKKLDEQQIDYEMEYFRIPYFDTQLNYNRIAYPDFYIPSTNTIIEIKSSYTLDIQNMKDKVKVYKEQGYNFKLILEHKEEDLYTLLNEKNGGEGWI